MGINEGDYLVAIDGKPVQAPTNPFMLLEGTAGRAITIAVNDRPSMDGAREIVVEPVTNEGQLRTLAWVAKNQKRVDELSGGRLASVWLPNTGQGGYQYFNRMYFAQQDREGAVIDERNNGGGSAADYIIDLGPEGGSDGGQVVATGTPKQISSSKASHTGAFLKKFTRQLKKGKS